MLEFDKLEMLYGISMMRRHLDIKAILLCFFKKSWNLVGELICKAMKAFFWSGVLLKEINVSILHLVPKGENPSSPAEYRPIACYSILYKIISKMICYKLQHVLPILVSPSQSAFVEGGS